MPFPWIEVIQAVIALACLGMEWSESKWRGWVARITRVLVFAAILGLCALTVQRARDEASRQAQRDDLLERIGAKDDLAALAKFAELESKASVANAQVSSEQFAAKFVESLPKRLKDAAASAGESRQIEERLLFNWEPIYAGIQEGFEARGQALARKGLPVSVGDREQVRLVTTGLAGWHFAQSIRIGPEKELELFVHPASLDHGQVGYPAWVNIEYDKLSAIRVIFHGPTRLVLENEKRHVLHFEEGEFTIGSPASVAEFDERFQDALDQLYALAVADAQVGVQTPSVE